MASDARKAQKFEVARGASASELARAALAGAIAQIRANQRAARGDRDPEATHQLRVGVRRLRVILRLFEKQIGAAAAQKLLPDLRWVFQRLGAVRDYDVLIEGAGAQPTEAEFEPLQRALVRERDKAARAAVRALASKRYAALVRTLRKLSVELEASDAPSPRARKWLKKRLDRRLDAVLERSSSIAGDDEPALHELRKQLKKLRYTADVTHGLFGAKRTKRYLRQLSKLQDVLGPINDAAVGRQLLGAVTESLEPEARQAAEKLADDLDRRVERNLKSLPRAFEKLVQAEPFWH